MWEGLYCLCEKYLCTIFLLAYGLRQMTFERYTIVLYTVYDLKSDPNTSAQAGMNPADENKKDGSQGRMVII